MLESLEADMVVSFDAKDGVVVVSGSCSLDVFRVGSANLLVVVSGKTSVLLLIEGRLGTASLSESVGSSVVVIKGVMLGLPEVEFSFFRLGVEV